MGQILYYPLNKSTINAGYKNDSPGYHTLGAGSTHYGVDLVGTSLSNLGRTAFFASGNGEVIAFSNNEANTLGRWLIVKYFDVEGYGDIIARHFHLDKIHVTKGQKVNLNTVLANYGNTGRYSTGPHLHIELDRDVIYLYHTPVLSKSNGGLIAGYQGARDTSTINPCDVFHIKKTAPENQSINISTSVNRLRQRYMKNRSLKVA